MDTSTPRIDAEDSPSGRQLLARGAWTAADLTGQTNWRAITTRLGELASPANRGAAAASWDLRQLDRLDYLGAQLLWNHWGHQWPPQLETTPGQRAMLETVAQFAVPPPALQGPGWLAPFLLLGSRLLSLFDHLRSLQRLLGQLLLDMLRLVRRPQQAPWRDFSGHLFNMGATAMPITALVGFLIGVVLA